jgi:hypothetical protein
MIRAHKGMNFLDKSLLAHRFQGRILLLLLLMSFSIVGVGMPYLATEQYLDSVC